MKTILVIWGFVSLMTLSSTVFAESKPQALMQQALDVLENDLDEAQDLIEQAIDSKPSDPQVYLICGEIMGRQARNAIFSALKYAKKALNCLQSATDLAPDDPKYRRGLISFYVQAPTIAGGDIDLAREHAGIIKGIDPAEGAKAELMIIRSQDDEAAYEARLAELLEQYVDDPELPYIQGMHYQRKEDYDKAFASFQKSVDMGIQDDDYSYHLALYQIGRSAVHSESQVERGIEALQTYVKLEPGPADLPTKHWAYGRMAQLYKLLGNAVKQQEAVAFAKQSNDKDLKKLLKKLR